jgi:hypothetical protein
MFREALSSTADKGNGEIAQQTADELNRLILASQEILPDHP